jgi:acyl phosphate:glycerol-3-phosphate acyltransferase
MLTALLIVGGYLSGSIPAGYWLPRALGRGDIRSEGSGNIGATNVWRVHGAKLGLPVMLIDIAKGFVPALLASLLVGSLAGVLAGAAASVGHWRPLFLGLKRGGKIVATTTGAFLGVAPIVILLAGAVWGVVFAAFRYASLSSIAAAFALPICAVLLDSSWPVLAFAVAAGVAVVILHRANIQRLRAGTETKFQFSRK